MSNTVLLTSSNMCEYLALVVDLYFDKEDDGSCRVTQDELDELGAVRDPKTGFWNIPAVEQ